VAWFRSELQRQWPTIRRWLWRLAIAAIILSLIGWFSAPTVSPLMCKIYG